MSGMCVVSLGLGFLACTVRGWGQWLLIRLRGSHLVALVPFERPGLAQGAVPCIQEI